MKIFAAVLIAVCVSAGAAEAKAKHMLAACADGAAAKATCLCKSSSGTKAICKAGQWCHTFAGMCSQ
jgi:hypothetical protein